MAGEDQREGPDRLINHLLAQAQAMLAVMASVYSKTPLDSRACEREMFSPEYLCCALMSTMPESYGGALKVVGTIVSHDIQNQSGGVESRIEKVLVKARMLYTNAHGGRMRGMQRLLVALAIQSEIAVDVWIIENIARPTVGAVSTGRVNTARAKIEAAVSKERPWFSKRATQDQTHPLMQQIS